MSKIFLSDKIKFLLARISRLINNNILALSFEVTLSCNCNCRHCDLGGFKEEERMEPKDYARIVKELKPLVVQVSGGEPLLRPDILEIVRAIKQFSRLPYTILVSNGALLNEELYLKLKEAGANQFSISLDFPDERHDNFRRHPGLFKHLEETLPKLAKYNFQDIILNSCITKANFRELIPLAQKAEEWGVKISYSAYTSLRTGSDEFSFSNEKDLKDLKESIFQLIEFKKKTQVIINSNTILLKFLKFLEKKYMPNCQAGLKFVVVMPDGSLIPCSMKREKFSNLKTLRENFSKHNRCGNCYVAIRCYSERSIFEEIKEISSYLKLV